MEDCIYVRVRRSSSHLQHFDCIQKADLQNKEAVDFELEGRPRTRDGPLHQERTRDYVRASLLQRLYAHL